MPTSDPWPTLTFRIPPDLRDRLQTAAGDRPLGEEVRRRLESSFGPAPMVVDTTTKRLLAGIAAMAEFFVAIPEPVAVMLGMTGKPPGPWYKDAISFAALRDATVRLLGQLGPREEADEMLWKPLAAMALNTGLREVEPADRILIGKGRRQ